MRSVCTWVLFAVFLATPAFSQPAPPPAKPEMRESCPGMVAGHAPRVMPVSLRLAQSGDRVRIHYVGHSTFMLTSPAGVTIATDYNDYLRPRALPDIITMNHAHSTHFTDHPDPAIKHVLRGWSPERGKPVHHDVQFEDVRIRNVPTNIRVWGGEGTEKHGNSIFVFEMAGLCIAHLGHLHHTLTQQQLDEMGRVDVVMVPVDGNYTLDRAGMVEVLRALKAPLVIPMHYFTDYTLELFLKDLAQDPNQAWEIERTALTGITVAKATLPARPKVLVLLPSGG